MEIRPDEFQSFTAWLGPAVRFFIIAVPVLIALAIFICYLISAARRGPVEAFYKVAQVIATAIGKDLVATSLRRIMAVTRLTIKEAIRQKVLVAFVIFVLVILFAGWFLDVKSDDPAHLYLSFVLTTTNYLVLALALFLATFSLPSDIKTKTIYTVVTKPIRSGEIVLGRILGFGVVITVLLAAMGVVSYLFVERGMAHEHAVNPESVAKRAPLAEGEASPGWEGTTTSNSHHRHTFQVGGDDKGRSNKVMGHHHAVTRTSNGTGEDSYEVGRQEGALEARVPIYGKLRFLDREGNPTDKGVSVGKEWHYRSYIEGRTLATAIWAFEGVDARDFDEFLPLAMTLSVFRTHKGNIEKGVRGVIIVNGMDPEKPFQCEPIGFESTEFETLQIKLPRKLRPIRSAVTSAKEIDLFEDLMYEGKLEIWVRCDDPVQYFGVAQSDLYVEAPKASFQWNFAKAYVSIWLQMVIVVCLGVMFSTFLSTPVAILATSSAILLGFFQHFVRDLWTGEAFGGGPIEASIRLVNQDNLTKPLDFGTGDIGVTIVKFLDNILLTIMQALSAVLPNFSSLGRATEYVAYNFNYYDALLARQCLVTFLYVTAITIVGYFFLKTREIAA